jgi:hypothetical protein
MKPRASIALSLALFSLLSLPIAGGAGAALSPDHFAAHGVLASDGQGPYHRLTLPLAVYLSSARPDLGDLRIYNARGEALAFSLLQARPRSEAQQREANVPFFPLRQVAAGKDGDEIAVSVRRGSDGTLIAVRQGTSAAKAPQQTGLVIDASRLTHVRALRLVASAGAAPFAGYQLETGNDLQHWRMLRSDGQYAHLEHAGQQIEQDRIDWEGDADRYLRLSWDDPQQAPQVRSVLLTSVNSRTREAQMLWTATLKPARSEGLQYEYDLPGQVPLERLRINLPEVNSVAPFTLEREVLSYERRRRRQERGWEPVARSVAYRLGGPRSELVNGDFDGDRQRSGRLRLTIDDRSGSPAGKPPALQVGFVPQDLLFLARGDGPYTLAWGAADAPPTDLPIATLLPGYRGGDSLPAVDSQLKITSTDLPPALSGKTPPTPSPYRRWILWGVLLAGLAALALMARSLAAQLRHGRDPQG